MKASSFWTIVTIVVSMICAMCGGQLLRAAVETRPRNEYVVGVPTFPRDENKNPTKGEYILNVNVPDPDDAKKMISLPVGLMLDPADFPPRPAIPAQIPAWEKKMKEIKAQKIVEAINKDEQIRENNKKLAKAGRKNDMTRGLYKKGDVFEYDNKGKKVRSYPDAPHVYISDLRYDLTSESPLGRVPLGIIKDDTKEPTSAVPARQKGPAPMPMPTPSPGSMGGKEKKDEKKSTGKTWSSTPEETIPSEVSFGYFDNVDGGPAYIATVNPGEGQTDEEILQLLASQFLSMGVPFTYDPDQELLTLNVLLGPNQTMWYDNSDSGLDFFLHLPVFTSFVVPEPSTIVMLGVLGAGGLLLRRRRRKPRRRNC